MTTPVYRRSILGLALGVRLAVVLLVLFVYPKGWLFSKAPDLGFLAQSLRSGQGLSSPFGGSTGPSAFLAPGYPAIVALAFRIFGSYSFAAAAAMMAIQTLFSVLTVGLMLQLGEALFGAGAANLAGAFWAVSLPLVWLPAVLWDTSLSILLLLGMVALSLRGGRPPNTGYWVAMGVYCGLAMLVNPSLTLALLGIAGWRAYQASEYVASNGYTPWFCLLALCLVFAPWPLRNERVLHAFIPLRSNLGYELWQGNHEGGTGMFDANLEPLKNEREYRAYAVRGEVAYMHDKGELARGYIRHHPREFLRLCLERVIRFWLGAGARDNSGVMEAHAALTALLGWAGLMGLGKQRRALAALFLLPLLVFPLPYYVTHADFRFRLVLDPLLTLLSADAVVRLHRRWQARHIA